MNEIQTLNYNGQKLRTAIVEGNRLWAIYDVSKIIKASKAYYNFSQKLSDEEKKIIIVDNAKRHGGSRLIFVSNSALYTFLNRSYHPEAVKFQHWIEEKFPDIFKSELEVKSTPKSSIQAILQKAQMLIRIAEHKAVPLNEQLRLLDLATKELTGTGLDLEKTFDVDPINILELPEVVGFIHEKVTQSINGKATDYLPAELMVIKWREFLNNTFDAKYFSELADEFGYKNPEFGFWKKVLTPDGEAREFM